MKLLRPINWRHLAVAALVLALVGTVFALAVETDRDRAIAAAQKWGRVIINPISRTVQRISLSDGHGYREVLPLLKDVPDLQHLSVGSAPLSEQELEAIGDLTQLPSLSISNSNVESDDLRHIGGMTSLRELRLAKNPITDDGLKHLARLKDLEVLDLSFTQVHGEGLQHVSPTLTELFLTGSSLDDESIENCTQFRRLIRLDFVQTKVTVKGLMKLTELPLLTSLGFPNEISREAKQRFRHAAKKSKANGARSSVDSSR